MAAKENNNNMRWSKDRKYVLEKVDQIEKIHDGLSKRVRTATFVTVMTLMVFAVLSIGSGLLAKIWELSNGVARIEGMLTKLLP